MSNRARLAVSGVWVGISFWNAESCQVVSIMTGRRVLGGPVPSDWIHMWLLWAPCLLSVMMFAHYCLETFAERGGEDGPHLSFSARRRGAVDAGAMNKEGEKG